MPATAVPAISTERRQVGGISNWHQKVRNPLPIAVVLSQRPPRSFSLRVTQPNPPAKPARSLRSAFSVSGWRPPGAARDRRRPGEECAGELDVGTPERQIGPGLGAGGRQAPDERHQHTRRQPPRPTSPILPGRAPRRRGQMRPRQLGAAAWRWRSRGVALARGTGLLATVVSSQQSSSSSATSKRVLPRTAPSGPMRRTS